MSDLQEAVAMRPHIDLLDKQLDSITSQLRRLVEGERLQELVPIWKRPGWTTPAEFQLVLSALEGINQQVGALDRQIEALVRGADLVGSR